MNGAFFTRSVPFNDYPVHIQIAFLKGPNVSGLTHYPLRDIAGNFMIYRVAVFEGRPYGLNRCLIKYW